MKAGDGRAPGPGRLGARLRAPNLTGIICGRSDRLRRARLGRLEPGDDVGGIGDKHVGDFLG